MTHPEQQYLDLLRRIRDTGFHRPSPHGTLPSQPHPPGTVTLINQNLEFDLSQGWFPMMTVRQMGLKPVVAELLWFLSGSTSNEDLRSLGARIWDDWATQETAGEFGYKDGELGPVYGYQWRNFGGRCYHSDGTIHHHSGFDQISSLVREIQDRPWSKRMMVTSWNPQDAEVVFIAPCHGIFRAVVQPDYDSLKPRWLHLHMFQRSADVPVGVPFNIASYCLLLLMLAQVTGLQPGKFYHTLSDAHIYENQVTWVEEILKREPMPYPSIEINPGVSSVFDFQPEDFQLINYQHQGQLKVPVAI